MSVRETNFVKWVGGIVSTLIAAMIISFVILITSVDVMVEKIEINARDIIQTRNYHERDLRMMYDNISEMKGDQKIIKSDIKELLKK